MSTTTRCDACGKEIPEGAGMVYTVTKLEIPIRPGQQAGAQVVQGDVCRSCESEVEKAVATIFNKKSTHEIQHERFQRSAASSHRGDRRASP